jgi:hypothetical protein
MITHETGCPKLSVNPSPVSFSKNILGSSGSKYIRDNNVILFNSAGNGNEKNPDDFQIFFDKFQKEGPSLIEADEQQRRLSVSISADMDAPDVRKYAQLGFAANGVFW